MLKGSGEAASPRWAHTHPALRHSGTLDNFGRSSPPSGYSSEQNGYAPAASSDVEDARASQLLPQTSSRLSPKDRETLKANAYGTVHGAQRQPLRRATVIGSACPRWFPAINLDDPVPQGVLGMCIAVNAIVMWLETDYHEYEVVWRLCEHFFNLVFTVEMIFRMSQHGAIGYFAVRTNIFDFVLVLCGILDNWLLPVLMRTGLLRLKSGKNTNFFFAGLRLVSVLRILRLFRLFRTLVILAAGFMKAIQAVLWVGLIIVMLIYVTSICLTRIIGMKAEEYVDSSRVDACWSGQCSQIMISEQVQFYFGNVPQTMYTLFMVMTLTNWPIVVDVAKIHFPAMDVIIVVFVVMTTYTLLSLLTAVITDNMITAVRNDQQQKFREMEAERTDFLMALKEMFEDMDGDKNGLLSREEFLDALHDENLDLVKHCATLGIGCTDGKMDLTESDLVNLFDMISLIHGDRHGHNACSIEEFITGFSRLRGSARAEDILTLQYDVTRLHEKMDAHSSMLHEILHRLDSLGAVMPTGKAQL